VSTKLPRLAITLDASTTAVLAKLSELQRRPKSAIAADLLQEMTPALQRIALLLEAATKQRDKLPADTAARLNELEAILGGMANMGMDRLAVAVGKEASYGRSGRDEAAHRRGALGRRRKPGPPVQ
jgi:hypothetical protein